MRGRDGARSRGGTFPGELVIVAVGLHESPVRARSRPDVPPRRVRLHGGHGRRRRARRLDPCGCARRLRDVRDHDPPGRRGHPRADDRGRHAKSKSRRRQGDRGDPHPQRGAGGGRARVGRPGVVLPRRGARRRLLQPPPGRVPPRRHAPLGAGEHGGDRRRPSSGRCSSRSRRTPVARSTSTCRSRGAPTGSTPRTGSSSRSARRTAT